MRHCFLDFVASTVAAGVIAVLGVCSAPAAAAGPPASPHAATDGRFVREHWAEFGIEHANPMSNRRFRVNAPEVVLHPEFGSRSEVRSSGCLQLLCPEDPRLLTGAELYLELWGGHPGTANRRVTLNGRSTYSIADHGGLAHCTYQYPRIEVKRTDLVNGYNALQFAVDQGRTFWGHMIVDNACLRTMLSDDHPDLKAAGLTGFAAAVKAKRREPERLRLSLVLPRERVTDIASVEYQGFYTGYDENGNEQLRDWHGFTKARQPQAILGTRSQPPFEMDWDTSLLPDQDEVGVRAVIRFKSDPKLCYQTPPLLGVGLPRAAGRSVKLYPASDLPEPFWSRAGRRKTCTINVDVDPARIERAELHVVVWDGGKGNVDDYFTVNGQPVAVAGAGRHDLIYTVTAIDPRNLKPGANEIALLSDTEHHGIEVCLPGPALVVRTRAAGEQAALDQPATRRAYEQHALRHNGDPQRGRELFVNESVTRCTVCHKVGGQGGDAGPDLSSIGGKFSRPHLIESLLEPSRQMPEGYRTTLVRLADGSVLSGIVKEQTGERLALVDASGKRHELAVAEIAERTDSPLSLMPANVAEQLTAEQFTDLVAYLETLRPGGKPTPGSGITGPVSLPPGFELRLVASGLTGCTALEAAPDGRIFFGEQTGALRVVKDGRLLEKPFVALPVDSHWERGLIGVTVDPDFPRTPHVYVCYVAKEPYPHHRISRLTADGDVAAPGSEQVLLTGDDQRALGGKVPGGHQGGALHFGVDGKLYIAIGEQTAETPAQRLDTLQGKILRINRDGSIPSDNPFVNQTSGKYRSIWALGLRNPFTFAVRPATGELFINDVGGKFEEINRGLAGANYGWPAVEHGAPSDGRFRGPDYSYPQASIAGGDFCPADSPWPRSWHGRYFFADFVHGWIKSLDPDQPAAVQTFANGLARPVDLRFAADGSLYVLLRNAWVIDDRFQAGTSALVQIEYRSDPSEP